MTLLARTLSPDWGQAPEIIERTVAQRLEMRLRAAGAVVAPTSGTLAIYRDVSEDSAYLSPVAYTPGDTSYYSLPAVSSSESLTDQWVEVWTAVSGGVTGRWRRRCWLVGYAPTPRVDAEDLYAVVPELRHPARLPAGQTSWSPQILRAWDTILQVLTGRGKRPWLTIDGADLYAWHQVLSAHLACDAVVSDEGAYFSRRSRELRQDAIRAEQTLRISYEETPTERTAVGPSVISLAPPDGRRGLAW